MPGEIRAFHNVALNKAIAVLHQVAVTYISQLINNKHDPLLQIRVALELITQATTTDNLDVTDAMSVRRLDVKTRVLFYTVMN